MGKLNRLGEILQAAEYSYYHHLQNSIDWHAFEIVG